MSGESNDGNMDDDPEPAEISRLLDAEQDEELKESIRRHPASYALRQVVDPPDKGAGN